MPAGLADMGLFVALGLYLVLLWHRTSRAPLIGCVSVALACGLTALWEGKWQAVPGAGLAILCLGGAIVGRGAGRHGQAIAAAAVGAFAASALPFWFFPIFSLPAPDGPYRVGTLSVEMTDADRAGLLGRPAHEVRRLPVRIWYPAPTGVTGPVAAYTGKGEARSLGTNFGEPWFYYTQLATIRPHAMRDLPIERGRWPVIIFNHGFWSYPEQNTALVERLASHGYIVIGIGHPGDAVTFTLADGVRLDPYLGGTEKSPASTALEAGTAAFMGGRTEEERFNGLSRFDTGAAGHRINTSAHAWRDDTLFTLKMLKTAPRKAATIMTMADFSRVAVTGMSFGGSVAPSACARIPECRAAINLDGESFDFSLYNADFGRPLLVVLTGQKFSPDQLDDPRTNPTDYAYERWATAGEAHDIYRMRVASLRHLGLTDLLLSARNPFKARRYGTINSERGVRLMGDAALTFLDQHVKGKPSDFPSRFYRAYPEAQPHDPGHVRRWWLARNAARGCDTKAVRAVVPVNNVPAMRLGPWIQASNACE
jgi:predicted dienelactone hydrolase